ncbi:TerB family tellurite resistance protein [Neobacillus kokaensis]|uniref:Co-chaperone DjlA N-terminal domain-containing protein n=1 Tax=Neobacillus kokaensis TaxID=2759023 RepID=A0ABQ3N725_9BACI|nr:TerB family tellurite resistance protein [Neobacillus kokaensis]GHH99856.1 hypothetical protein AM1BK_33990 [Neobacillus kokaensis]
MFLAELQQDEREAFLELAAFIAKIDGSVSVFETSVLSRYKKEMELEDYKEKGLSIDEILTSFKSERSKNIVLAELFQLIYADGVFHGQESEVVNLIKNNFEFKPNEFGSFKAWIDKIKELSVPYKE